MKFSKFPKSCTNLSVGSTLKISQPALILHGYFYPVKVKVNEPLSMDIGTDNPKDQTFGERKQVM